MLDFAQELQDLLDAMLPWDVPPGVTVDGNTLTC